MGPLPVGFDSNPYSRYSSGDTIRMPIGYSHHVSIYHQARLQCLLFYLLLTISRLKWDGNIVTSHQSIYSNTMPT